MDVEKNDTLPSSGVPLYQSATPVCVSLDCLDVK